MELNAFEPDPAFLAAMQDMLSKVPEGYGGISVDDLNLLLVENPDVILIDTRTAEEVENNGVIEHPNFVHIPLEEFIAMKDQWPQDLDAPIVVYCGSGHRSTIAMTMLWSYGYTDVKSMQGGLAQWIEAGYPVVDFVPEP
jgi:rhodanese-related sulfurtransferase